MIISRLTAIGSVPYAVSITCLKWVVILCDAQSGNLWLCWYCIFVCGLKVTRVEMEPCVRLSPCVGLNQKRRGILVLIWKCVIRTYSCNVRVKLCNYNICMEFGAWGVSDVWCTMWMWMNALKSLWGTETKKRWNRCVCAKICGKFDMLMLAGLVGKDVYVGLVWCALGDQFFYFFEEVSIFPFNQYFMWLEVRGKIVQLIFTHTHKTPSAFLFLIFHAKDPSHA